MIINYQHKACPHAYVEGLYLYLMAAVLIFAPLAFSQPLQTGGGSFVIEIDTAQSKNISKSLGMALMLSALMPGGGELYLQEKELAKPFVLVEAGFWAGLFFSIMARDSYLQSARHYASAYAGIDAGTKDDKFLSTMIKYRSYQEIHHRRDSYEQMQILSGHRDQDYDIPPREENYWDFGSPVVQENTDNWRRFRTSMSAYGWAKVAVTWAVGGLALGRVASLANTLHLYRVTSVKGLTQGNQAPSPAVTWVMTPLLNGPEGAGMQLLLSF